MYFVTVLVTLLAVTKCSQSTSNFHHPGRYEYSYEPGGPVSVSRTESAIYISFVGPKNSPVPVGDGRLLGFAIPTSLEHKQQHGQPEFLAAMVKKPNGWNHHPKTVFKELGPIVVRDDVRPVSNYVSHPHEETFRHPGELVVEAMYSAYPTWSYGPAPIPAIRSHQGQLYGPKKQKCKKHQY